jgi:hypothetical protein
MAHTFSNSDHEEPERFLNRKEFYSQNVIITTVDFDDNFVNVVVCWERSTHDNCILRKIVDSGFVALSDKYYLINLDYANTIKFLCLYLDRL